MPAFERKRVLIWGKTYPELSAKYIETVCTGGVLEDGTAIRLYPVPLRYLGTGAQYALYDWIDVPILKSTSDPRPESHKVDAENIRQVGHVDPDRHGWRARSHFIFKDPEWQFESVAALKAAEAKTGRSMGIVTPGVVEDVRLVRKPTGAGEEYEKKMAEVQGQTDFFTPEYKELEFLPYDLKLRWRCAEQCAECRNRPHDMKALDWGLLELARREGWPAAQSRLETISDMGEYDFKLYMGNFRLRRHIFGIIGMWYPKIPEQQSLL